MPRQSSTLAKPRFSAAKQARLERFVHTLSADESDYLRSIVTTAEAQPTQPILGAQRDKAASERLKQAFIREASAYGGQKRNSLILQPSEGGVVRLSAPPTAVGACPRCGVRFGVGCPHYPKNEEVVQ